MSVLDENRKEFKPRKKTAPKLEVLKKITKSQLKNAAILVVKSEDIFCLRDPVNLLLGKVPKDCLIWICRPNEEIATFSEKEMEGFGWVKKERLDDLERENKNLIEELAGENL